MLSDAVDQALHPHPIYTRDYWRRFFPDVLGRDLRHGSTANGLAEQARYRGSIVRVRDRSARLRGAGAGRGTA